MADHLARLMSILGDTGLQAISTATGKLTQARGVLANLRKTVLTPDLLPGTGEEAWRKMFEAARDFSAIACPRQHFPVISKGARCPLCQQLIEQDGATHFKHFAELVTSSAQDDVRDAEADYTVKLSAVSRTTVKRDDVTLALEEIDSDAPALAKRVEAFLGKAVHVKQAIENAAASGKPFPTQGVQGNVESELREAARGLRERAIALRAQRRVMDPREAAELKELETRAALQGQLDVVLGEIERQRRLAAYGLCIDDTSTTPLTRKSTDLTKRLVTDRLRDEFKGELTKLEFTHLAVEIKAAGDAKGALLRQLVFSNAPGVAVSKVLSEGEARTLSLAAFLAELTTTPAGSAIIFDDPVSSLDHIYGANGLLAAWYSRRRAVRSLCSRTT